MTLGLADKTVKYPRGIVENLLIKVDKLVFPVDFVVLDMEANENVPLILGRLFLCTVKALIYVFLGTITLRVVEETIFFKVNKTRRLNDRAEAVASVGESEKEVRDEKGWTSDPRLERVIEPKCGDPSDRKVEELEKRILWLQSKIETLSSVGVDL
ncbi:putative aspartic peptidase domain superfamily [Helianthus annuus]|nr:putative aspartic peptidase domain superfamily [Helianthus annuus]KAJ0460380.1 putative aspartic peptidase domain superfamily [Helianthus annuus]